MWNNLIPNSSYSLPNLVDPFVIESNRIRRQQHQNDEKHKMNRFHHDVDVENDNNGDDKNILLGYLLYDDRLHEGRFGCVRLGIHRLTMVNVVVKIINKNRFKVGIFFLAVANIFRNKLSNKNKKQNRIIAL